MKKTIGALLLAMMLTAFGQAGLGGFQAYVVEAAAKTEEGHAHTHTGSSHDEDKPCCKEEE